MPCDLSLVIPCYNESIHLIESVARLLHTLDGSRLDYEVVFVDDFSRDNTRTLLDEICAESERCRAIFHEANMGRGGAFKTGYRATDGEVCGFIDIDLEIDALYIPALVSLICDDGYDVATGHRFYLFRQTRALHRHVLSRAYRMIAQFALGFGIRDSETGCKFFKRATATRAVLGSKNNSWFWDTEVMARAAQQGLRIAEMPVLFLRQAGKPSSVRVFRDSWQYLIDLQRFRAENGLSLTQKSPLYWTGKGYDFAMRRLYGVNYTRTFAEVARRIPAGASVVDLCSGTCRIERDFLRTKGCDYIGLDVNADLIMAARRAGVKVRRFDLLSEDVPEADYVIMCSSFYHFRELESETRRLIARGVSTVAVEHLSAEIREPSPRRRAGSYEGKTLPEVERDMVAAALRETAGKWHSICSRKSMGELLQSLGR
ncbi:MAG: glycosyltransferase [Armatimonadetes bacterium]|nr:glycosyltransferase [Armatimonadota bacterium]